MNEQERRLLSPAEFAKKFMDQKSVTAVHRAIRKGQLPAIRIGRLMFIDEDYFRDWVKKEMEKSVRGNGKNADNVDGIRRL